MSSLDPTPLFPFGHGLSYTTFGYSDFTVSADEVPTDGEVKVSCVVGNEGDRAGAEVVQLYIADPVAQVTRPVIELAGFARVMLEPGERTRVTFTLHADRTSFTGADLRRIVEPGEIRVMVGASSEDIRGAGRVPAHRRAARRGARPGAHDAVVIDAGQPRLTAAPVLSRTTSSGVIAARARASSSPRIASSSISTLRRPISSKSWRTVVSGGVR